MRNEEIEPGRKKRRLVPEFRFKERIRERKTQMTLLMIVAVVLILYATVDISFINRSFTVSPEEPNLEIVLDEDVTEEEILNTVAEQYPVLIEVTEETAEEVAHPTSAAQTILMSESGFLDYSGYRLRDNPNFDQPSLGTIVKIQAINFESDPGANLLRLILGERIRITIDGPLFDALNFLADGDLSTPHSGDVETFFQAWRIYEVERDGEMVKVLTFEGIGIFQHGRPKFYLPHQLRFDYVDNFNLFETENDDEDSSGNGDGGDPPEQVLAWIAYADPDKHTLFDDIEDCERSETRDALGIISGNGVRCQTPEYVIEPQHGDTMYIGDEDDQIEVSSDNFDVRNLEEYVHIGLRVDRLGINIPWVSLNQSDETD